ncbi:MAG: hypothetical protein SGBAC_008116 [Bacillariaceae sp.]
MNSVLEREHEIQTAQETKSNVSRDETISDDPSCPVDNATNNIKVNDNYNKHHVHFSADKEIYPTLHKLEYTAEEKRKTWINLDDLDQIKKARRSTIKRMNKGSKLKKGQYTRGLDEYTREGSRARQQVISDSIQAVVNEQSNQKMQNERNIGQIAEVYGVHSLPCQLAAYGRGLSDHVAADESDCGSGGLDSSVAAAKKSVHNGQAGDDTPSNAAVGWQRS